MTNFIILFVILLIINFIVYYVNPKFDYIVHDNKKYRVLWVSYPTKRYTKRKYFLLWQI